MWHRYRRHGPALVAGVVALLASGAAPARAAEARPVGLAPGHSALASASAVSGTTALTGTAAVSGVGGPVTGAPSLGTRRAARYTATVATGNVPLRLRWSATTEVRAPGRLPNGTRVRVRCQLAGESIAGSQRTTRIWDRLSNGRFVSDAYIRWSPRRPAVPWCSTARGGPPATHASFVNWAAVQARGANTRYRVPISVTVAQAILESGWGRSGLTKQGASFFGMKCFGSPGPIALGCRPYATSECGRRGCYRTSDWFRVYARADRSFLDHARQLATLSRYRPAFAHTRDANRFIVAVHRGGYATSPTYSTNLISLMRQYKLYRFDKRPSVPVDERR
jgi:flagellar protein FlgJ